MADGSEVYNSHSINGCGTAPNVDAAVLLAIARMLREHRTPLAVIEQRETGRPHWHALAEIETASQYFEFYAGLVNVCRDEVIDLGVGYPSYTRREPFGVVGWRSGDALSRLQAQQSWPGKGVEAPMHCTQVKCVTIKL